MNRVVIIVDATELNRATHLELWKADRENVASGRKGRAYKAKVKEVIKESVELKALNYKFMQEELQNATSSGKKELFQQLVDADPNLAALLSGDDPEIIVSPLVEDEWDGGKRSPTFIIPEKRARRQGIKIPLNQSRSFFALTDAENGYFSRADNRGEIILPDEIWDHFNIGQQLHNGKLRLKFTPKADMIQPDTRFEFPIAIKDDGMAQPVESEENVLLIIEQKEKGEPPPPIPPKPKEVKGLPDYVVLTKTPRKIAGHPTELWHDNDNPFDDFNDKDGGFARDLGDGKMVYKINFDNVYHLNARRKQSNNMARDVLTEKYILGMLVLMLGFEKVLKDRKSDDTGGNESAIDNFEY
ncbi:MAG: hypothetical protein MJE68_17095, partial [Proteobacteria bacterium]|nr:hypothetical protein [Pseudomonadota bacterium]